MSEDYDSGPYCRHYADPADCDEMCKCGHPCHSHLHFHDAHDCNDCSCDYFEDLNEEETKGA